MAFFLFWCIHKYSIVSLPWLLSGRIFVLSGGKTLSPNRYNEIKILRLRLFVNFRVPVDMDRNTKSLFLNPSSE